MKDFKTLLTRTISGIIYIAIIIGCILGGETSLLIMASVFAGLAVIEFARISHEAGIKRLPAILLDIAGCICLCFSVWIFPIFVWIFVMLCRFIEELYLKDENPLANLSHSMMSQIYIGLPFGLMVAVVSFFNTCNILLAVFLFIWINDTGAFVVGSLLGRHRLFERISPKKSWEGFFGGLFFNIVAAALLCSYCSGFFGLQPSMVIWLGLAVIVTVFGTWGDLVESLIKRTLHIKDSGNLIPGHGGILDRIDSLLLVMPAVFLYLFAITQYPNPIL